MIEEDRALLRSMTRGFSGSHFFRSCAGERGVAPEEPFGLRRLYKWWKKACANIGVEGVDLYGGNSAFICQRPPRPLLPRAD